YLRSGLSATLKERSMPRIGTKSLTLALIVAALVPAAAQDSAAPAKPETKATAKPKPPRRARTDPPGTYMGRPMAEVMSFMGADWLIRPEREQEEQPEAMLDALKIKPGSTVADVGAGVGYTSVRLAKRVGPEGLVYATDVQPEMLRMLSDNLKT